ncbi:MAG: glycosyl transferase [Bdellovibrio sp. CG10_big_fil_rev_8_21_14_0_10_47_8]|nr:MAG: glycosyl transferase [Bdellovibrio sp. CG10_big_fil_rev_8_21_14_0_10_47_8]
MSANPKVSIITVCYNSASTIADTIESVLSQDYPNIEYIVIDGKSKDNTVEIIRRYEDRIAHFISEKDGGIYDAMNKGLKLATGDIVGLLNSDDFYIDSKAVSDLVNAMTQAGTDSVFADLIIVDPVDPQKIRRYYDSSRWTPGSFRFGWMPAHTTFFIKREWYEKLGLFSLKYKIASDFEMLVRLLYTGKATYVYLQRPVIRMRAGGLSTRGLSSTWTLNREIVQACRSHQMWTSLPLLFLKIPAKLLETWRPESRFAMEKRN